MGRDNRNDPLTVTTLRKAFRPKRKQFGKLVFVDEKLRSFSPSKWSTLYASTRRGFLVEVDKRGEFKPLNIYKDPRGQILPRTLSRWLKEDWEIQKEVKKRRREEKNVRAIRPNSIVRVGVSSLPKKIMVLDIETSGRLDEPPNPHRILLVGIKEFNLVGDGYQPSAYEPFEGNPDWSALRQRLNQPVDLILGHNLFGFDYYFLETITQIEPVAAKTVDLFLWLCSCVGFHRGLGLNDLCRLNLGVWKARFGKSLKELSAQPDKTHLYRYNERDLDLTFRLWLHAVGQRTILTRGAGALKAGSDDLDYLFGRKPFVGFQAWMEKRRAWNSKAASPLHSEAVIQKFGHHDTDKVVWPSYSVIVCSCCRQATVFCVTESFERIVEDGADFPSHRLIKRDSKTFRLRCSCGESVKARSSAPPVSIGNFPVKLPRKRTDDYYSAFGHSGSRFLLAPFGKSWEQLFREFKLGRITSSSTSFKRQPTPTEAALLSAAVGEEFRNSISFNEKRTAYLLIDGGETSDCHMSEYLAAGLDSVLEEHLKSDASWICRTTLDSGGHCRTCGTRLSIHDIPLVHPVFQTPICQPCVRLGRHRYFHHGKWQPELKKRRGKFFDELEPTTSSRELTAYYLRSEQKRNVNR